MRAVIQRVSAASVQVDGKICGQIGRGLLVYLGIHQKDTPTQTEWLVNKLLNIRIFSDDKGKMNLSLLDVKGELLLISQFTLYANSNGGRRPDFLEAALPEAAEPIYHKFIEEVKQKLGRVQTGKFGAHMEVSSVNEGPVTLIIDGREA